MSVFENLPYEISTEILSYLPCADLASTCTVSRHMYAVSKPLLYKAPCLTSTRAQSRSTFQTILRTLLSPGGDTIATWVRSLHVQLLHNEWELTTSLSASANALLLAAASRFGPLMLPLSDNACLVVLLNLLPQLSVLELTHTAGPNIHFTEFIVSQRSAVGTSTLSPGLCQLREFRFSSTKLYGGLNEAALLTLLHLPCIRKLEVFITNGGITPLETFDASAGISRVTSLRLSCVNIDPPLVERILKVPIALTDFSLTATGTFPTFRLDDFGRALEPVRGSLLHLRLDIVAAPPQPGARASTPASLASLASERIGSLRGWAALRSLVCSLRTLLGRGPQPDAPPLADILPAGIRRFEILKDRYWSMPNEGEQIQELMRQKNELVPALEMLTARLPRKGCLRPANPLRVACEGAAVTLVHSGDHCDMVRQGNGRGLQAR